MSYPIGTTGGRDIQPTRGQLDVFWRIFDRLGGTELHHGAAPGWDTAVAEDAKARRPKLVVEAHPANWRPDGPGGEIDYSAGPRRNSNMARMCFECIAAPGGTGTQNCIKAYRRLGKPVHFIEDEPQP